MGSHIARLLSRIGIFGKDGSTIASTSNPVPTEVQNSVTVSGALTDAELRASPVPVSTTIASGSSFQITDGVDTLAVEGDGSINVNTGLTTQTDALTDTELRAADVKVTLDGELVDISDRAARDLGKVDVAALDQYTPADVDSGVGTENALPVSWRKAASGGSVEFGTAADPIRVDPTGTTTQPISDGGGSITVDGTVAATQSGTWNVNNVSGTVSLPTGAATEATLAKAVPEQKGGVVDSSVTANTDILSDMSPTNTPCIFRVYACMSTAGKLSIKRTDDAWASETTEYLNDAVDLVPDAAYFFDVPVDSGEEVNVQYSVAATARKLSVHEVASW